jgi:hypothetical protein
MNRGLLVGRIGRWSGWVLLPLLLADLLTGYAIVFPRLFGGILGKALGFRLHILLQPALVALSVLHVYPYARAALRRSGLPALIAGPVLLVLGLGLAAFSIYLALLG